MEFKLIAHRLGFEMTNYDENSLKVLEEIFDDEDKLRMCDGFEFDIRFTKDNIPILFHDKTTKNFSNKNKVVKKLLLNDIKSINLTHRNSNKENLYGIYTLEEILIFFENNKEKLKNKIIKIETKDRFLNKNNIKILCNLINRYKNISENIVNLSFSPINLFKIKRYQIKNKLCQNKTDLLCDYKIMLILAKFIKEINTVSLRYTKECNHGLKNYLKNKFKNKKIFLKDYLTIKINDKMLNKVYKRYKEINIYTIEDKNHLNELLNIYNKENLFITTDNPKILKEQIIL